MQNTKIECDYERKKYKYAPSLHTHTHDTLFLIALSKTARIYILNKYKQNR